MDDSEYESVLFIAREVYVYRIPARVSAEGYKAADWGNMIEPLWKGRIRVLETGSSIPSTLSLRLEDADTGDLFAVVPYLPSKTNANGSIDPASGVEAVLDSSRYFVVTVVDPATKAKAYLGMGFPERSESFDFNVALQEWTKRQTPTFALTNKSSAAPARDFSLKPGQTLNIKLGSSSTVKTTKSTPKSDGGALPFLLPPPPAAPRR